jgi:hypothetical protein
MHGHGANSFSRLVEYDAPRRRLWILGQRCHHGATGTLLATLGCLALVVEPPSFEHPLQGPRSVLAGFIAAGAGLMLHDWKDRSMWFERGRGSQA